MVSCKLGACRTKQTLHNYVRRGRALVVPEKNKYNSNNNLNIQK
jgi:hypothetical protein